MAGDSICTRSNEVRATWPSRLRMLDLTIFMWLNARSQSAECTGTTRIISMSPMMLLNSSAYCLHISGQDASDGCWYLREAYQWLDRCKWGYCVTFSTLLTGLQLRLPVVHLSFEHVPLKLCINWRCAICRQNCSKHIGEFPDVSITKIWNKHIMTNNYNSGCCIVVLFCVYWLLLCLYCCTCIVVLVCRRRHRRRRVYYCNVSISVLV